MIATAMVEGRAAKGTRVVFSNLAKPSCTLPPQQRPRVFGTRGRPGYLAMAYSIDHSIRSRTTLGHLDRRNSGGPPERPQSAPTDRARHSDNPCDRVKRLVR